MKSKWRVLCFATSSLVLSMSSTSVLADILDYRKYFDIDRPSDVVVSSDSSVEDFVLFRFMRKNEVVLTVYVGNAPERVEVESRNSSFEVGDLRIVSKWGRGDRLVQRDWYARVCEVGWPRYIHMRAAGSLVKKGDRMASSLKLKATPVCE